MVVGCNQLIRKNISYEYLFEILFHTRERSHIRHGCVMHSQNMCLYAYAHSEYCIEYLFRISYLLL